MKNPRQNLILEYLPCIKGIAFHVCWTRNCLHFLFDDCESVATEALIKAIDSYDKTTGASLKTWIIIKVRFAVIDFINKETRLKRNYRPPIMVDIEDYSNSIETATDGIEQTICDKDMIYKILSLVKPGRRKREIEDSLTYLSGKCLMREVADQRGCSEANVSMMIAGLKKKIRGLEKELL